MLKQKQKLGLISKEWKTPEFSGEIIPILLISNHNESSKSKENFKAVIDIIRKESEFKEDYLKSLQVWNYTENSGIINLSDWNNV